MLSPPTALSEWYATGPWSRLPHGTQFHDYYSQPKSKQQAWVYFGDGDAHELAHAVLAPDEALLDPHWGDPMDDPYLPGPIEEMDVFAIQIMIEAWCGVATYDPPGSPSYRVYVPIRALSYGSSPNKCRVTQARRAHKIRKEWDIERIWAEYQRKVDLVMSVG